MIFLRRGALTSFVFFLFVGSLFAQTNQDARDGGVNIGGNNEGFVNTGEISIIVQSEAMLTDNPQEQQALEELSRILEELTVRGELSVSEVGVRLLARNAIETLAQQPLTRNVIETRQFVLPWKETYNIAGTNHRITYEYGSCGALSGIKFSFDRDQYCWQGTGGTLEFSSAGQNYELVFDGYDSDKNAMFTIYPAE